MSVLLRCHSIWSVCAHGPTGLLVEVHMNGSQMLEAMREFQRQIPGSTWAAWMDTLDREAGEPTRAEAIESAASDAVYWALKAKETA